jgi:hydroxymethylglutaryl-CoA reductase
MKKQLFAILFLAFSTSAMAQFTLGVKGGVNFTNLSSNVAGSFDSKLSYVAGVYLRLGDKIYIQPEVLLSASGAKFMGTTSVDIDYTNLDVPVLIGTRVGGVLRLNAGAVASFNVGGGQTFKDLWKSTDSGIKNAAYSYVVGAGVDLGSLSFDLRYQQSITDVASNSLSMSGANALNAKASAFQATLGLRLF